MSPSYLGPFPQLTSAPQRRIKNNSPFLSMLYGQALCQVPCPVLGMCPLNWGVSGATFPGKSDQVWALMIARSQLQTTRPSGRLNKRHQLWSSNHCSVWRFHIFPSQGCQAAVRARASRPLHVGGSQVVGSSPALGIHHRMDLLEDHSRAL